MPLTHLSGDLSVFGIDVTGGTTYSSFLGVIQNVRVGGAIDSVDASPITRVYRQAQEVKQGVTISTSLMTLTASGSDGDANISHLDLSAFTLFGQDYRPYLQDLTFTISPELVAADASGDRWKFPVIAKKTWSASGTIMVPTTAALGSQLLLTTHYNSTFSSNRGNISFTVDGGAVTAAGLLTGLELTAENGGIQTFSFTMVARGSDSGTYPASPTGTTTLVDRLFNSLNSYGFSFTNHATEGVNLVGNMVPSSGVLRVQNGQLYLADFTFESQGAVTATAN